MKNRIKKVLLGSITRELLLVNLVCFTLVVTAVFIAVAILYTNTDTIDKMVADSNSLYVEVTNYVTRGDKNCDEYLKELGRYYKLNAAVTDLNGNIILKSQDVNSNKIDLQKIYGWLQTGSYNGDGEFYQVYNVRIDSKDAKLVVWKKPRFNKNMNMDKIMLLIAILPVAVVVLLIYMLTRKKAKYIKNICRGIKTISSGNLDYRIHSKGVDELAVLADEINNMSDNLKNQIEEERKAERLKSELITNVSHDLRTPLTSLIAYLQLAEDNKTLPEDKERYVKIAAEKSNKLKKLIEDLFEYSKLESGGICLNKSNVNIIEIIEQSIGELSIQARNKNITFNKNFSGSSTVLSLDSDKMGRVFENIISNAVKYSSEGSTVNIKTFEERDSVLISFENTPDILFKEDAGKIAERVFERFYRGDSSRNSKDGGSGLGLAIAKSIVELHGGHIWAESENEIFRINLRLSIV